MDMHISVPLQHRSIVTKENTMSRIADLVRSSSDIASETVEITRWGVTVEVRGMNGLDRSLWIQKLTEALESEDPHALAQLDAELVVASVYDPENGEKAFVDSDVPMLLEKAGDIIGVLSAKSQRMSGLDGKAEERLGKGFSTSEPTAGPDPAPTPSDVSSSDSPVS